MILDGRSWYCRTWFKPGSRSNLLNNVIVAAVQSKDKDSYLEKIQMMDTEAQEHIKHVLEEVSRDSRKVKSKLCWYVGHRWWRWINMMRSEKRRWWLCRQILWAAWSLLTTMRGADNIFQKEQNDELTYKCNQLEGEIGPRNGSWGASENDSGSQLPPLPRRCRKTLRFIRTRFSSWPICRPRDKVHRYYCPPWLQQEACQGPRN